MFATRSTGSLLGDMCTTVCTGTRNACRKKGVNMCSLSSKSGQNCAMATTKRGAQASSSSAVWSVGESETKDGIERAQPTHMNSSLAARSYRLLPMAAPSAADAAAAAAEVGEKLLLLLLLCRRKGDRVEEVETLLSLYKKGDIGITLRIVRKAGSTGTRKNFLF